MLSPAMLSGNGSMVGAIVGSCKREPIVVGKPSDFMLDNIATTFKLKKEEICMVGDRLDTDIMFGKNGGLTTALVLSGEPHTPYNRENIYQLPLWFAGSLAPFWRLVRL
jgi:ribonucleotide monophosphatase NagD (HAD superfamily)